MLVAPDGPGARRSDVLTSLSLVPVLIRCGSIALCTGLADMKSFGGGKKPFLKKRLGGGDAGGRGNGNAVKGKQQKKPNTSLKYQIRSLERLVRLVSIPLSDAVRLSMSHARCAAWLGLPGANAAVH